MKLRIQADIQQRAPGLFSKRAMGIFFSRYTTGNAYLKALTLAPHRFDLDGQAAGEISDEHRQLAAEELARRRGLHHRIEHLEESILAVIERLIDLLTKALQWRKIRLGNWIRHKPNLPIGGCDASPAATIFQ